MSLSTFESPPPDVPLGGRVAYVTGAARGQGRAHCVRLAAAGADIIAIDACGPVGAHLTYPPATEEDFAQTISLIEDQGRKVVAEVVDVRDLAGQQRVIASAVEQFGRLDIVVANAGVMSWGRVWELSIDQWDEVLSTNLTGFFVTAKATVPAMIEAGNGGSIIAISSSMGIKATPGAGHYCASKFGVVGLANALALELGEYGIRVNTVHSYGVDTPLGNDSSMLPMLERHPQFMHSYSPGALPTDALTPPEQISEVVVWLAGDGSRLLTAAQIPADRGYIKV